MKQRSRLALIAGLTVFLTAMGTTAGYALWSTSASTSAEVKAATVAMTVDGAAASTDLSVAHQPGQSVTSEVTLANSGTAPFTYNVAVAPNGGLLPHDSVTIALWKAASSCTAASLVPADAWTGTLAALATHGSEALAVSGSQVLCVRTSLAANATSAQQGQTASATLTFTATNGWTDSKSVAIDPSVYTMPMVQLPTSGACSTDSSEKTMTLNWQSAGPGFTYQLEFSPAASSAVIRTTSGPSASFDASVFTHRPGPGTVTIRAVDGVSGWVSPDTVMNITLANVGNSQKLRCP